ncbi:MAG: hypothetical protein TRG1_3310 [Flavobacteriaceae bacterium FS1-H7996/R]|nr:MAG: hypothetical protein TRG1_3310 [Flavobacteriaceae bacterium FS1-H7996/R]
MLKSMQVHYFQQEESNDEEKGDGMFFVFEMHTAAKNRIL